MVSVEEKKQGVGQLDADHASDGSPRANHPHMRSPTHAFSDNMVTVVPIVL